MAINSFPSDWLFFHFYGWSRDRSLQSNNKSPRLLRHFFCKMSQSFGAGMYRYKHCMQSHTSDHCSFGGERWMNGSSTNSWRAAFVCGFIYVRCTPTAVVGAWNKCSLIYTQQRSTNIVTNIINNKKCGLGPGQLHRAWVPWLCIKVG